MSRTDSNRRRFLQNTLAVGATLASPWAAGSALAAENGRVLIGFQLPPPALHLVSEVLSVIRTRYQPDLGTKPVVLPGSSGILAIQTVIKSTPDGATVFLGPSSLMTFAPLIQKLPFDPVVDLVPVAGIGNAPLVFMVGPAVPTEVRTMTDYVQWVRAHPNANSYGVPSLGDVPHFVGTQISRNADLPLRAVGYKGPLALAEDLYSGVLPAAITLIPGPDEVARHPSMRFLGTLTGERLPTYPGLPTLAESGLIDAMPESGLGIFMPAGTPDAKVMELAAAVDAAKATPAVIQAMAVVAMLPWPASSDRYAVELERERAIWQALVAKSGFTGLA